MSDSYFRLPGDSDLTGPNEPTIAQQPVFLPAPDEQQPYFQSQQPPPMWRARPVRPEDLVRLQNTVQPANPVARMSYLWKQEPAYRVLFIAIGVVLLSSFVFVSLVSGMFYQPASQSAQQGGGTNPQQAGKIGGVSASNTPTPVATSTPVSTVAPITMPTPFPTTMPTLAPTQPPTLAPTQPPANVPLTVQISSIPLVAQNGQNVPVGVTTNEPGATVHLLITYDVTPFSSMSKTQTTDATGNATISWHIRVTPFRQGMTVTAEVTAVAQDQAGQNATSPQMTVQITTLG